MSDYDLTIRDRLEDILDSINLKISQGRFFWYIECSVPVIYVPAIYELLRHANGIKVLEPANVRDRVIEMIANMYKRYSKAI
jgi:hypothetical protein